MSRIRDHLHDAPWYARKATLPVRNAAYRATRPIRSARGRIRNDRNRRFLQTGKGFWLERHTRGLRSSLPVYRNRINPGTGRPRRDDAEIYGRRDMRLAHARQGGTFDPSRAWENSPDAYRAGPSVSRQQAADRAEVRDVLARSQASDRARVAAHADRMLGQGEVTVKRAKGTPEQVRAFDEARRALEDHGEQQMKLPRRERVETPEFHRLNSRVLETEKPLSPWQRSYLASDWRMARADRAQKRAARRSSR